jgi:hypothetical protein
MPRSKTKRLSTGCVGLCFCCPPSRHSLVCMHVYHDMACVRHVYAEICARTSHLCACIEQVSADVGVAMAVACFSSSFTSVEKKKSTERQVHKHALLHAWLAELFRCT